MEEATSPEEFLKKGKEASKEVKETASAVVVQARSTVLAAWQETKSSITVLQNYTREHPIRAISLALGMGIFLGSFVRR